MKTASILIVDDEQSVLDGLQITLRKGNYTIYQANSVSEARAILCKNLIHLIICDEMMPGERGSKFVSELRETNPDIATIILSGQATMEAILTALNNGEVYRFLTKPCEPLYLLQTVHSALQQRELMIQTRELLDRFKRQNTLLSQLKNDHPGIDNVEKDNMGRLIIENIESDLNNLIDEIKNEIDGCDS